MSETLEGLWADEVRPDADASGIRQNPWPGGLRALKERGGLQDGLVEQLGARVLARFDAFTRDDRDAVVELAAERLACAPHVPTEARIQHAVMGAAIHRDLRRWVAQIDAPPTTIARELARAGERASALMGRERSVFFAVCALDDAAFEDEVRRVVLCGAVAYQVRWNTAHQNLSRAWRRICEGGPLAAWCGDWRAGHRYVCGPPPFELWEAGRAYLDTCSGRGGAASAPEAFEAWVKAHEAHQDWFNEWKRQSAHATRRWREFVASLDASGVPPRAVHAALVRRCAALGIDRWVVPAKVGQQTWRALLDAAHRPSPQARGAWLQFLRDGGFGPAVEAAFRTLEREADLVEVSNVELEHAYRRLLAAAEAQPTEALSARDCFRNLVDSVTVLDGAVAGDDAPPASWGGGRS